MNILFVCHKVPYPPNKGEKIRAFHIIKYLSKRHKIFLYSLCGNRDDFKHKEKLKEYCHSVNIYRIYPLISFLRIFIYLFTRFPLTFAYFFSYCMNRDIENILKEGSIDAVFSYCSSSAQYTLDTKKGVKKIIDFVDVDSDKWKRFADSVTFPLSLIYTLEAKRLQKWEKKINRTYDALLVTTEKEREKLELIDPSSEGKMRVISNGIDFDHFKPQKKEQDKPALIFTGQMDYLPNVDAAIYFYKRILPLIKRDIPDIIFYIVGRSPSPIVRLICKKAVITGYVDDIRDYFPMASVYVASLQIVLGVKNKVLEAMASGLPVVATKEVLQSIEAIPEKEILIGETPEEFAQKVIELLKDKEKRDFISKNAQQLVRKKYNWITNLSALDEII